MTAVCMFQVAAWTAAAQAKASERVVACVTQLDIVESAMLPMRSYIYIHSSTHL
jgi:hypothetical protein